MRRRRAGFVTVAAPGLLGVLAFFACLLAVTSGVVVAQANGPTPNPNPADPGYCYGGARPGHPIEIPAVPAGYSLSRSLLLTRHGARSSLVTLPSNNPTWVCQASELGSVSTRGGAPEEAVGTLFRKVWLEDDSQTLPFGNCSEGSLTKLGADQHTSIGQGTARYFLRHGFFDARRPVADQIWVRSTDIPRTRQSAQSMLAAFLETLGQSQTTQSDAAAATPLPVIPIHHMELIKDPLTGILAEAKYQCPGIAQWWTRMLASTEYRQLMRELDPVLRHVDAAYGHHNGDNFMMSFPDALHAMDCEGLYIPPALRRDHLQTIFGITDRAFAMTIYHRTVSLIRSRALLAQWMRLLTNKVDNPTADEPRFWFFSAHDTTVGPLLAALDIHDGVWPAFASHVFLELLERPTSSVSGDAPSPGPGSPFAKLARGATTLGKEYFVRLVYNGRVLRIPPCGGRDVCPLSVWLNFMQQRIREGESLAAEIC